MGQKGSKHRVERQNTYLQASTAFIHKPLENAGEQVRLLKILPKTTQSHIHATLETFYLSQCPPYQALSYTWGSEQDQKSIYLDSHPFIVRHNLYEFLRAYGTTSGTNYMTSFPNYTNHAKIPAEAYLWIDQLSIDQRNINEREKQVQLMRRIYRQAQEIVLWLGSAMLDEFTAITDIKHGRYMSKDKVASEVLLHNSYWRRLWVIQEMLLAREITIMCGHITMQWDQLDRWFIQHVPGVNYHSASVSANAMNAAIACRRLGPEAQHDFEDALRSFCGQQCSDLRDKVYGLLAVVRSGEEVEIHYQCWTSDVFDIAVELMVYSKVEGKSLQELARLRESVSAPAVPTLWKLREEMGVHESNPMQWESFREQVDRIWVRELDKRIDEYERAGE